ncbi:MAG: phosphoribosylformylglycinamidine cyclo-ligase, partial [Chloroflexota bacterium]
KPEQIATVVRSIAGACQAAETALLGGETAEMPGIYQEGELDLVGTIVGVVDQDNLIDGSKIRYGDKILALPSSGLHTNGFTLARAALAEESWIDPMSELDQQKIGDILLTPHRSYLPQISRLMEIGIEIHGLAHITGGGLYDNLPRILPAECNANIVRDTWSIPPIFDLIQKNAEISDREMFNVFNMGVGMLVIVDEEAESLIHRTLGADELTVVGEIVPGNQTVNISGIAAG